MKIGVLMVEDTPGLLAQEWKTIFSAGKAKLEERLNKVFASVCTRGPGNSTRTARHAIDEIKRKFGDIQWIPVTRFGDRIATQEEIARLFEFISRPKTEWKEGKVSFEYLILVVDLNLFGTQGELNIKDCVKRLPGDEQQRAYMELWEFAKREGALEEAQLSGGCLFFVPASCSLARRVVCLPESSSQMGPLNAFVSENGCANILAQSAVNLKTPPKPASLASVCNNILKALQYLRPSWQMKLQEARETLEKFAEDELHEIYNGKYEELGSDFGGKLPVFKDAFSSLFGFPLVNRGDCAPKALVAVIYHLGAFLGAGGRAPTIPSLVFGLIYVLRWHGREELAKEIYAKLEWNRLPMPWTQEWKELAKNKGQDVPDFWKLCLGNTGLFYRLLVNQNRAEEADGSEDGWTRGEVDWFGLRGVAIGANYFSVEIDTPKNYEGLKITPLFKRIAEPNNKGKTSRAFLAVNAWFGFRQDGVAMPPAEYVLNQACVRWVWGFTPAKTEKIVWKRKL